MTVFTPRLPTRILYSCTHHTHSFPFFSFPNSFPPPPHSSSSPPLPAPCISLALSLFLYLLISYERWLEAIREAIRTAPGMGGTGKRAIVRSILKAGISKAKDAVTHATRHTGASIPSPANHMSSAGYGGHTIGSQKGGYGADARYNGGRASTAGGANGLF